MRRDSPRPLPVPAPALIIVGMCSTQAGGAIAKTLFSDLGPTGTVLLRVGFAAILLSALSRPRGNFCRP